jgi:exopolysaccharide biosynthesis polyprenyl glycosylphosphotransferase
VTLQRPTLVTAEVQRTPLRVRTRLRERRPVAVRRHTGRTATRFFILIAGDAIAFLVYLAISKALHSIAALTVAASGLARALAANPADSVYFAGALFACLFITGSYSRHRALNRGVRLLSSAALASVLTLWVVSLTMSWQAALAAYVVTVAITWGMLLAERRFTDWFLRDVWPRARGAAPALLIRTGNLSDLKIERAVLAPGGDYRLAGYVFAKGHDQSGSPDLGDLEQLDVIIDRYHIEAVVVCGDLPPEQITDILEASLAAGAQVLYPAQVVRIPDVRPKLVWHYDQPFFELGAPVLKATAVITKRIVDIAGSILALVVFAPIFLIVAIAVKLDSPGTVFFSQDRAGLGGKRFRMFKFRTMRIGADDEKSNLAHLNQSGDSRLFKIPRDPRITRLGHALRRWSLDELPQFVNVLIGDMSLVGPRPFFETDFPSYEDHHFRRLDAKPGITGLWQVSGGSEVLRFEDVVYLDRQYIEQWSFWMDLSIMFRTPPAIFRRSGVY